MNLRGLDLNLLVVMDALLTERSTTRAGERIHLSQSAVSGALARLRHFFSDFDFFALSQSGATSSWTLRAQYDTQRGLLTRMP